MLPHPRNWLQNQAWLLNDELHHEVFRLIAETLRDADADVADALVHEVAQAREGEYGPVRTFNILAWMTRHAPNLASAQELCRALMTQPGPQVPPLGPLPFTRHGLRLGTG